MLAPGRAWVVCSWSPGGRVRRRRRDVMFGALCVGVQHLWGCSKAPFLKGDHWEYSSL